MCTHERGVWIAYNGEVYNHLELRQELEAEGIQFATRSDTEVLLAAYQRWGSKCLERFNGMFAFVLVDLGRGTAFAARDRFGVKPLYYRIGAGGTIAFASEIKQFAALPDWKPALNGQRGYDFLAWGLFDHTDETLFEGVYQLRGGEFTEIELDDRGVPRRAGTRLQTMRWYNLSAEPFSGSFNEASMRMGELLADSVRLRTRSDVPVGSCLSGGLDSSSIVCLLHRELLGLGAGTQKTFSAVATLQAYDESRFIDEVVRTTGVDAHRVEPGVDGLFRALDQVAHHQDEPFGSTSVYAQWHVFALSARHGVKVMMDGQGADEQLAGYHGFFGVLLGSLLRSGRWSEFVSEVGAIRRAHAYPMNWCLQQSLNNVLPEILRRPLRRLAGRTSAQPDWLDLSRLRAIPVNPYIAAGHAGAKSIADMSEAQLLASSLPMLLHWEDRNSMAHSVEARVPFLDYRLVEFVLGLPDEYKLSAGVTKRVLRQAMLGVLPETIRGRMDKLGFATPEEVWMKSDSPKLFRDALCEAIASSNGILRPSALSVLNRMIDGKIPFSFLPWRLISFGTWVRKFGVQV
jgi:asparagine synthase (glutamine-hydrolysing)